MHRGVIKKQLCAIVLVMSIFAKKSYRAHGGEGAALSNMRMKDA